MPENLGRGTGIQVLFLRHFDGHWHERCAGTGGSSTPCPQLPTAPSICVSCLRTPIMAPVRCGCGTRAPDSFTSSRKIKIRVRGGNVKHHLLRVETGPPHRPPSCRAGVPGWRDSPETCARSTFRVSSLFGDDLTPRSVTLAQRHRAHPIRRKILRKAIPQCS